MSTCVYLRPTGFVDAPFGYDGQVLRLAGGLAWFSAIELILREDGRRTRQALLPVAQVEVEIAGLPPPVREAAERTLARLAAPRTPLALGTRVVRLDQPQVAGILNMTPDSFSDGGGLAGPEAAAEAGMRQLEAGAALLDVGGESTRPGAKPVWEGDERARILPVVARLAGAGAAVSVDTRKASVMAAALDAGAAMVNDVSALTYDPEALALVAERGCPVVLMHHQGTPETMQRDPRYDDVLLDVHDWLADRVDAVVAAGVRRDRIVVDPGIGFGKTLRHTLGLLNGLSLFHGLGCPIMLGASRKRFIGALSGEAPVEQRLGGSVAVALLGAAQGVQLLRVHDVAETVQALRVWRGLRDEALSAVTVGA